MYKNIIFIVFFPQIYSWDIYFEHTNYTVYMDQFLTIPYNLTENNFTGNISLEILPETANNIKLKESNYNFSVTNGFISSNLTIYGVFLGYSRLLFTLNQQNGKSEELETLKIIVVREKRLVDRIFTGSVATLVSLIYINFGCALNYDSLKSILRRPIGPFIGFCGQFIIMPILSYLLGILVFLDYPEMSLGLFFVGVSPAGGASNIWTVILDGNIDLSVTMTTLSTICAFFMMPFWLFTLGNVIFKEADIAVPYDHIGYLALALIVPLFFGLLIQKLWPKIAKILVKILKPSCAVLILFIIIFAIATHMYLFQLATWRIAMAGLLLPFLGYVFGGIFALIFKQNTRDSIAISIETGVQNTGIAIFLLRFILPQPQADLTTVIPVAIAVMTPIPLTMLFLYKKCFRNKKNSLDFIENSEMN